MHRAQEQVRDFHRANGPDVPAPEFPHINWEQIRGVRTSLIKEEFLEYLEAVEQGETLSAIREVCDMLYVLYGWAVACGIDIEPFFEEVHRANMLKSGGPKREDGKVLKPAGWVPPDMERVFHRTYPDRRVPEGTY